MTLPADAAPSAAAPPDEIRSRFDADRSTIAALLEGEPPYRLDQVWDGLYRQAADPADISNLPVSLRRRLDRALPPALQLRLESTSDSGDTVKWLWSLADGHEIETVLMIYPARVTVCVSSQAGCAMGCGFCATGQAGFDRQLTAGEIVEQVIRATQRARQMGRRVSNVVFMGMGEPLANYDRTWSAIRRLHDDAGIGARHITVSTVGVVPGIDRMAGEDLPVNLAVSLHAADDTLRDELVPLNRRYPLAALAEACGRYLGAKGRRLSFEWALIDDVNDRPLDAEQLAAFVRPLRAHVNLIPLNPTPGYPATGTPAHRVARFAEHLEALGVNATIRRNRGTDIDAACGQLRASRRTTGSLVGAPVRRVGGAIGSVEPGATPGAVGQRTSTVTP